MKDWNLIGRSHYPRALKGRACSPVSPLKWKPLVDVSTAPDDTSLQINFVVLKDISDDSEIKRKVNYTAATTTTTTAIDNNRKQRDVQLFTFNCQLFVAISAIWKWHCWSSKGLYRGNLQNKFDFLVYQTVKFIASALQLNFVVYITGYASDGSTPSNSWLV